MGYFCVGMTIIFAISGIAVNHINDWNPNYKVERVVFALQAAPSLDDASLTLSMLASLGDERKRLDSVKASYWESETEFKLFLKDASSLSVDLNTNELVYERVAPRHVLKAFNFLHLNEGRNAWVYFSDLYACLLLFLALSSLFMVKGKRSPWGRKSVYLISGILIPLTFILIG